MKIIRTHRIRLNPTPEQVQYLYRACGTARFAWNWALEEYERLRSSGQTVNWNTLVGSFRAKTKTHFPWVRDVTASAPEQAIRDLRQAVSRYYKTKKSNPRIQFPGKRSRKKGLGSLVLSNIYLKITSQTASFDKKRCGGINMAEPLRFPGRILSGRIKEKAGHWYLTVTVETDLPQPTQGGGLVGIDFGLSRFAVLSNGEIYENQAYLKKAERRIRGLQRNLSRKAKGSKNRQKQKVRIGRAMERIANQRNDFLHKFSTSIIRRYATVCIEDLNLRGLMKTRVAKALSDTAIGKAVRQLEYKAEWYRAIVQRIDRFYPSSKLCSSCGYRNAALALRVRLWTCPQCHTRHDRDINAAINISLEGVRLLAGSNHVGVTPVDGQALALSSDGVKLWPDEAGIPTSQ